jgi:hypothetical protein
MRFWQCFGRKRKNIFSHHYYGEKCQSAKGRINFPAILSTFEFSILANSRAENINIFYAPLYGFGRCSKRGSGISPTSKKPPRHSAGVLTVKG